MLRALLRAPPRALLRAPPRALLRALLRAPLRPLRAPLRALLPRIIDQFGQGALKLYIPIT